MPRAPWRHAELELIGGRGGLNFELTVDPSQRWRPLSSGTLVPAA